jgi:hypothetical protein
MSSSSSRELLSLSLFGVGLGLLAALLAYATQQQGVPLEQLGAYNTSASRPMTPNERTKRRELPTLTPHLSLLYLLGVRAKGRGLWSYLFHYCRATFLNESPTTASYAAAAGVRGYDPILGALSPPLRLLSHLSTVVLLWSAVLFFWPGPAVLPDADLFRVSIGGHPWPSSSAAATSSSSFAVVVLTLSFVQSGIAVGLTYLFFMYLVHHRLRGVSDPGGPRLRKIQRKPTWKDADSSLGKALADPRFRFATGRASHKATEARFAGTSAALTGEPTGRDIWSDDGATNDAGGKHRAKRGGDERLVKEMASGGRDDGSVFNPSKNPNR